MPALVCGALAGWALAAGEIAFAATVMTAFHLCLRTGEALGLTGAFVQLGADGRGVVSLPWTKTSRQKGARENVTLDDPFVGALLHWQLQSDAAARLWPSSLGAFHRMFRAGLRAIGCSHLRLTPYSLRRGGATHEFSWSGDLAKVMVRGRWTSQRTARIYIQDGAAVLAEMRLSKALRASLETHVGVLQARIRAYAAAPS